MVQSTMEGGARRMVLHYEKDFLRKNHLQALFPYMEIKLNFPNSTWDIKTMSIKSCKLCKYILHHLLL